MKTYITKLEAIQLLNLSPKEFLALRDEKHEILLGFSNFSLLGTITVPAPAELYVENRGASVRYFTTALENPLPAVENPPRALENPPEPPKEP